MKDLSGAWVLVKNKYLISATFFIIWMLFFDPKDWNTIHTRTIKLSELEKSEQTLSRQIEDTRKELALLKTNAHTIEKYAREKYFMKKDNEDLFIVKNP